MEKRRIAFFDFDGTLYRRDSFFVFALQFRGAVRLALALLKSAPAIIGWKLGRLSNSQAKQRLFSALYKGVPADRFDRWGQDFSATVRKGLNPCALPYLSQHQSDGDEIYIVSASMEPWIKPWAVENGFTGVIATVPEVDSDGILTGRFSTPNCHGQEKVTRIRELIPDVDRCDTWAYGDSSGDREMFWLCKHHKLITH